MKVCPDGTNRHRFAAANLEAEQALLGAVLANNKAYEKVSEFLRPYHFADSIHAKIFEVISKLIQRGHVADVITLKTI